MAVRIGDRRVDRARGKPPPRKMGAARARHAAALRDGRRNVSVAPTDYVSIAVTIPEEDIEDLPEKVLPKGWRGFPYLSKVQKLGRDWAVSKR